MTISGSSLRRSASALLVSALAACSSRAGQPSPAHDEANASPVAATATAAPSPDFRTQLDGRAFPSGVLALTYDDGPDEHTLELAEALNRKKIAATFFVVGAWAPGLSSDPGQGSAVFASGVEFLPILNDLRELRQRIANHTENHVLLWRTSRDVVRSQLLGDQRRIDPFIDDELALFRAPGGAWDRTDADVVASDARLSELVGPVRWDIDEKDWEGSLSCNSTHRDSECEPAGPGGAMRVKPRVMAARYLSAIESSGRGIVLFHTRVGHVGSRYSVELAEALIPELEARGYVFAAPVLRFSAPLLRFPSEPEDTQTFDTENVKSIALGDIDGDGRSDICAADGDGVVCAISVRDSGGTGLPTSRFARAFHVDMDASTGIFLADLDGDGRADLCARNAAQLSCALATANGFARPLDFPQFGGAAPILIADLDGDKKAEIRRTNGVVADVNGDGRADVCSRAGHTVECALSNGITFGVPRAWSVAAPSGPGELVAADLNGDGRVDLCVRSASSVSCAFSRGKALTEWTTWSDGIGAGRDLTSPLASGDINGDGRTDLCGATADGIVCGVAP